MESPFDVLGVDPDADDVAVERAYRERVLEAHPDHGGSMREFQRVRAAYAAIQEDRPEEFERARREDTDETATPEAADEGGSAEDEEAEVPDGVRVEYLDYDVLADLGLEIDDEDLFARAAEADLDRSEYGEMWVPHDEPLLKSAEAHGLTWPYACRGGACSNCAVAVRGGEMPMPTGHILPEEWLNRGIRLSCLSAPTSDEAQVVFNVKHLPGLDDLRLPPSRFDKARLND
ncbi:ferredoxin Fer [Halomarina rubra]|uniref:Ferredoxin Fer n=1 Tax=Halomarina rubra TaxID=2071873 RepID=A0ABD6AU47_9EURY